VTSETSPWKMRAAKKTKTTPCKVADGGWHSEKQLDASGKSGAYFDYSEVLRHLRCDLTSQNRNRCPASLFGGSERRIFATIPAATLRRGAWIPQMPENELVPMLRMILHAEQGATVAISGMAPL